jgi:Flp pilus assembly protein TadG
MRRLQSGQALVEWSAVAFVLLLFALGLIAVGQIVGEYMDVRSAATQAAFAAARAPSAADAQQSGQTAAREAVRNSQVEDFQITIDAPGFQRGSTLTATATGYVRLSAFPIVNQVLGERVQLRWQAHALVEPYRSRAR